MKAKGSHEKLAKEISGENPYLQCTKCGKKKEISQRGVAERLKNGWEKCCGYTMRYYPN